MYTPQLLEKSSVELNLLQNINVTKEFLSVKYDFAYLTTPSENDPATPLLSGGKKLNMTSIACEHDTRCM